VNGLQVAFLGNAAHDVHLGVEVAAVGGEVNVDGVVVGSKT
jgi:hypothetical protein